MNYGLLTAGRLPLFSMCVVNWTPGVTATGLVVTHIGYYNTVL